MIVVAVGPNRDDYNSNLGVHQFGNGHGRAGMKPIGGGLGLGRGGEEGALVGSKDAQPVVE